MIQSRETATPDHKLNLVPPQLVETWLRRGDACLVDVREDYEHAQESIEGAQSIPLSTFDPKSIRERYPGQRIVFHCQTGKRAREAASRFGAGSEETFCLAGGIDAWKAAGHGVVRAFHGPRLPIMRQVQVVAGSLVFLGSLFAAIWSSWFLLAPLFVGGGLVFAGLSGWCGMALLLARMPWNDAPATSGVCCEKGASA